MNDRVPVQNRFIALRAVSLSFAPPMICSYQTISRASTEIADASQIARDTNIQHESLILAQDERWRRA